MPDEVSGTQPPADIQGTSASIFELITNAETRQWAESASASSEYSGDDWSADQATGTPDTDRCGDYQTAWASAASDSVNTLVLTYTQSVYPQAVIVHQTFNPDQVTQIRLMGDDDQESVIYQSEPRQIDQPCPYSLTVIVDSVDFRVDQVELTIDQSQLGLGWNQIDAVQLIGEIER